MRERNDVWVDFKRDNFSMTILSVTILSVTIFGPHMSKNFKKIFSEKFQENF